MKSSKHETIKKIAIIGLLTAFSAALSYVKIPIIGPATVTLVLPVVVMGAVLYGPLVGAWLTVIPNITAFSEAGLFMQYSPAGCIATLLLKGILAGLASGLIYKLLSKQHPLGAVTCSAIVAPIINSGVFVLGCYIFIWDELVSLAGQSGVGIGMLLFGLAGMNFIVELIINLVLCPSVYRILQVVTKKKLL